MAQQPINHGSVAGDGQGESLFSAFTKVNANDAELFGAKTEFYANYAALPAVGEIGKVYVTLDDDMMYRWTGTEYDDLGGIQFVANAAALPATGEALKVYIALDTGVQYRWTGSAYVAITFGVATDTSGRVSAIGTGRPISLNRKRRLNASFSATLLTDFTTGTLAYNGGAASDTTQLFLGNPTQKIPHNATAGLARIDWTHPTTWTQGNVYGFWYRNTGSNTLYVDVMAATTGFAAYVLQSVALEPTGTGWKFVTFGQKSGQKVGTVTIGTTALNLMRIRECINAPWGSGDFVNIGPIFQSAPRRAFAMIHFDDCNQNVYTNGLPITSDYDIPCTVNVITSLIGGSYLGNPTFTAAQLKDVYLNHGWAVCSHTRNHPNVQSSAAAPTSVVDNGDGTATVTVTTDSNGNPGHGLTSVTTNPRGVQVVMSGFTPPNFNSGAAVATVINPTQFTYPIVSGSGPVTVMGAWNPGFTQHGLRNLPTYAAKLAEIQGGQDDLLALGFDETAYYLAYPQGGYDVDTIAACKAAGVRLARGTWETVFWPSDVVSGLSVQYGTSFTQLNTNAIPPYQRGMDVPAAQDISPVNTWAAIKAEIDIARDTGGCWVGLVHSISGTRGTAGTSAYLLETVCQYLHQLRAQGLMDLGTMHDYHMRMSATDE